MVLQMVGRVGIEPTQPQDNGVTDRPSSPTLAPAHKKMTLSQSTAHLLIAGTFALPIVACYSRHYTLEGVGAKGWIRTNE